MNGLRLIIMICVISVAFLGTGLCLGGDLDDGISKYTDGSIVKEDELGKPGKNLKFIVLNAIMMAKNKSDDEMSRNKNSNSIVIGAGANLAGTTIINVVTPDIAPPPDVKNGP
jgi:hypothetical protein